MEMHTLDSLRRTHGIDVRPSATARSIRQFGHTDARQFIGKARSAKFRAAISIAARWLANGVRKLVFEPIAKELRYRRDARRLTEMSDYLLNDIGITRDEIHYYVRFGHPNDNV